MNPSIFTLLQSGIAMAGGQDTNPGMIPLLRAGDHRCTNGDIDRVPPAYVDIGYDGGIDRIVLSNILFTPGESLK